MAGVAERMTIKSNSTQGGVMITKILVPIDGSETARKALEYAVDLAKQTG